MSSRNRHSILVALLLVITGSFARAEQSPQDLADSPEVQRELVRGEEPGSSPRYEFQYATPEDRAASRRFLVFLRQQVEDGVPLDSEIVVIAVRQKGTGVIAERIFRDVSVLGLRESRRAALSERELRAIFRAKGLYDQARMGGREKYLAFARSRLAEGDVSRDERWIFTQILGKGWEGSR